MEMPVALITGSGRRLGRQIALSLAKAGYDIVINYNESVKEAKLTKKQIEDIGVKAIAIQADISKAQEVHNLVRKSLRKFGKIDVLINNAAVFIEGSWDTVSELLWEKTLATNLKGTFFCSQLVAKEMVKQRSGKIINIASLGGIQAWIKHIPYSVSKAGVIMLTKCLAKALAPYVTVNAIAPGTIIIEGAENPAIRHMQPEKIPLKKYGNPSDISDLVIFLTTKANYVTGQVFVVDGGRSINSLTD